MSLFLPYRHVSRNVHVLSEQVGNTPTSDTREVYRQALNAFQSYTITQRNHIDVVFDVDAALTKLLVDSGGVASKESMQAGFFMDERQRTETLRLTTNAQDVLERMDKEARAYVELLVRVVVCCNSKTGGGSLAQNLGVIWFSPKKHWTPEYMAENLYHESLHQALFLEDMIHGVFADVSVLNNEQYQVTSNFLNVKRPFDMAFHGVFVAAELHHWYQKCGDTEKANSFISKLHKTLIEMDEALARAQKDTVALLTSRGEELYAAIRTYVVGE